MLEFFDLELEYGEKAIAELLKESLEEFIDSSIVSVASVIVHCTESKPSKEITLATLVDVFTDGCKLVLKISTLDVNAAKTYLEWVISKSFFEVKSYEFKCEIKENCNYTITYAFETDGDFSITNVPWAGLLVMDTDYFAGTKVFNSMQDLKEFVVRFCHEAIVYSDGDFSKVTDGIWNAVKKLEYSDVGVTIWQGKYLGSVVCITRMKVEQNETNNMNVFG